MERVGMKRKLTVIEIFNILDKHKQETDDTELKDAIDYVLPMLQKRILKSIVRENKNPVYVISEYCGGKILEYDHLHVTFPHDSDVFVCWFGEYACDTECYKYADYGKTWSLSKEDLENGRTINTQRI